jgi:5'-3' exoribonuclease 1
VFDSNCITPGTEFMAEISKHLRYFMSLWLLSLLSFVGQLGVSLSMSMSYCVSLCLCVSAMWQVPGEGEHKIMDFIRSLKDTPGFDPNTR